MRLTADAGHDLASLYGYIAGNDSVKSAEYVLGELEAAMSSLQASPERGSYVKELLGLGIKQYREIYFKPYRLIYRLVDEVVVIYVLADGRRDMQALLQRRVLR